MKKVHANKVKESDCIVRKEENRKRERAEDWKRKRNGKIEPDCKEKGEYH